MEKKRNPWWKRERSFSKEYKCDFSEKRSSVVEDAERRKIYEKEKNLGKKS